MLELSLAHRLSRPSTPNALMFTDLAFSPDSRLLAGARQDRMIAVWEAETGKTVHEFAVHYTPYRISFTPDSGRILACFKTKVIEEWSIAEARRLRVLKRKTSPGICGAFSPDGRHAAVAGGSKRVAVFELETGGEGAPLAIPHGASVVNFSPSGRQVVAGVLQAKDALTVWDFESRRMKFSIRPGRSGGSGCAVFSPDETLIAYSGFFDGSVTLWKADNGAFHSCLRQPEGQGRDVAFHRDGRHLLALGDYRMRVLNLASGEEFVAEPPHPGANVLATSADGRFAATGGLDDHVFLWKTVDP